jgi:hypothetical protein
MDVRAPCKARPPFLGVAVKVTERVTEEPLQVYEDREAAARALDDYAALVRDWGITSSYRVKARPMVPRRTKGTWGVWLVKHDPA